MTEDQVKLLIEKTKSEINERADKKIEENRKGVFQTLIWIISIITGVLTIAGYVWIKNIQVDNPALNKQLENAKMVVGEIENNKSKSDNVYTDIEDLKSKSDTVNNSINEKLTESKTLVAKIAKLANVDTAWVPIGSVVAFAGDTTKIPPKGWMLCDGRMLPRDEYSKLFAKIGFAHGRNPSSTVDSFNIPDYRGYFLRGVDHGAGVDPDTADTMRTEMNTGGNTGDKVGSIQNSALMEHLHRVENVYSIVGYEGSNGLGEIGPYGAAAGPKETDMLGAKETRPINAYVNWIIKYE